MKSEECNPNVINQKTFKSEETGQEITYIKIKKKFYLLSDMLQYYEWLYGSGGSESVTIPTEGENVLIYLEFEQSEGSVKFEYKE